MRREAPAGEAHREGKDRRAAEAAEGVEEHGTARRRGQRDEQAGPGHERGEHGQHPRRRHVEDERGHGEAADGERGPERRQGEAGRGHVEPALLGEVEDRPVAVDGLGDAVEEGDARKRLSRVSPVGRDRASPRTSGSGRSSRSTDQEQRRVREEEEEGHGEPGAARQGRAGEQGRDREADPHRRVEGHDRALAARGEEDLGVGVEAGPRRRRRPGRGARCRGGRRG